MTDEVSRILLETRAGAQVAIDTRLAISEEEFFEEAYLSAYPDVAENVARGMFQSGFEHYQRYGQYEGRHLPPQAIKTHDHMVESIKTKIISTGALDPERASVEAILVCPGGGLMIVGWVDDTADPLECILLASGDWQVRLSADCLVRVRRRDVESALGISANYSFGFIGFHFKDKAILANGICNVEIKSKNQRSLEISVKIKSLSDTALLEVALSHLHEAEFFSNPQIEAISNIRNGFGNAAISLNGVITKRVVAAHYVERFGLSVQPIVGSIVVCLYGRLEFLFLQSALFSNLPGIEDYEFIYVSNSPELNEALLREAKSASRIYDLRITVVLLPGNAGFGAANNAAVNAALSNRILNVNPDVFPLDSDWAQKHTRLVKDRVGDETRLFGVPLYYDDGSLMHGGMYFELDSGLLLGKNGPEKLTLVRVEHYGKGAPAWVPRFTQARRVPAVTGAFISSDRAWYEKLGGFTEDYIFGHYEDADLCLKSLANGSAPWIHDLRLWHLEGKGSTRRPVHEGGSLVNRWFFSDRWSGLLEQGLLGPAPDMQRLLKTIAAWRVKAGGRESDDAQLGGKSTRISRLEPSLIPHNDPAPGANKKSPTLQRKRGEYGKGGKRSKSFA